MDPVRTGAWIVALNKILSNYNLSLPMFDDYEAIVLAAKGGMLLSAMSALGPIPGKRFHAYRRLWGLGKTAEWNMVFPGLESLGFLDVKRRADAQEIEQVTCTCTTKESVFDATASLFKSLGPSPVASISILLLEKTCNMPLPEDQVADSIVKAAYDLKACKRAIHALTTLQVLARTEETEQGQTLLFNPYVFATDTNAAFAALKALSAPRRQQALEIAEYIRSNPGVPLQARFDAQLVSLLSKVGLIDTSSIRVSGKGPEFPTAPQVWGVMTLGDGTVLASDLIDDAKVLLDSIRYGQYYSPEQHGRIKDPTILLAALISKGEVGPATAIGQDYPLCIGRGIVDVVESRYLPGRFYMELRKPDVAEAVLEVITHKVILPRGASSASSQELEQVGTYISPEQIRVARDIPPALVRETMDGLAFEIRTQRRR